MSGTTPHVASRKSPPRELVIGDFSLEVISYSEIGERKRRQPVFEGASGTAWLTLDCVETKVPTVAEWVAGPDVRFVHHFEVVDQVANRQTEVSLKLAQEFKPGAAVGDSIAVPVHVRQADLNGVIQGPSLAQDWIKHLPPKGRVLVSFDKVTIQASGVNGVGRIVEGKAEYPAQHPVPKRLELNVDDFTVILRSLTLAPESAHAEATLLLPGNVGSEVDCGRASLDLGRVTITPSCRIYAERPKHRYGPWIVGDTGLVVEGVGYIFDGSDSESPPGWPGPWRGLRLHRGTASGKNHVPDPCNTGYLGGAYELSSAVVTSAGLWAVLKLSAVHMFSTLHPLGYEVRLDDARLLLKDSSLVSGTLGPGSFTLPKLAVRDDTGSGLLQVSFTSLTVQSDYDVSGLTEGDATMSWGELTHPGSELLVWKVKAQQGLVSLPAGPERSFCPATGAGFVELVLSGPPDHALLAVESAGAFGLTLHDFDDFVVRSPDRPSGLPLELPGVSGWLRIDTLGVDGQLRSEAHTRPEPLGEPASEGYVSTLPFDTRLWHRNKTNLAGQFISSAVCDSNFAGSLNLPPPSGIPQLAFSDLELTSTAHMVGGVVALPSGGVKLDYWQLDLVPTGPPDESGVMSVRTGRIVFTAAGIHEPMHFGQPFRLTWGEILADGNLGRLAFDHNNQGQRFDGFPYRAHQVSLSPFVAGTAAPFLATCGSVHFHFFGAAFVNIRDALNAESAEPYKGRFVKVIEGTDFPESADTDLHLVGNWHDTTAKELACFEFLDADMAYNVALQNGFIGTGTAALGFLAGAPLEARIEARKEGIDIRVTSTSTRDLDLGLFSVVGGMAQVHSCVRIESPRMQRMSVYGLLEQTVSAGMGILAPKEGSVVEVNISVTPHSFDFFASGSMLLQAGGSAADLYAQVHLLYDYQRDTAEGEIKGRIDCNNLVGGLEGEGQVTWFVGPTTGCLQGSMRIFVCGWTGKGAMEGGFFLGHNVPRHLAWVLQPDNARFGVSHDILPSHLTGFFGYGRISVGFDAYLFGGGVEIYAGLGAFSTVPPGLSGVWDSDWSTDLALGLPYVIGSCGVHVHGEILGGLVSASAWADLDLLGPVPIYFEGIIGLEGCVLWVLCASVELTCGLNRDGFYVS